MVLTYVVVILVGLVIRASFIVWSCDHMCGCCGGCLVSCNRDDNRVLMCSVVVVCLVVILVVRVLVTCPCSESVCLSIVQVATHEYS